MAKFIESFSNHLTNWGLVWFCFIFWGSIFNAILISLSILKDQLLFNLSRIHALGLIFGIFAKYKNWGG